ncbi:hypothetical protein AB9P05_19780 [Roseivirga sp. BDSF3-8]|uniref:hypothetical protein n=1 Tax=Roseivirga sp. BDSF3-8 TaxID=3241598 RepID=UPI0035322113
MINNTMRISLFFLMFWLIMPIVGWGQIASEYSVDPVTGIIDKPLPFHRDFVVSFTGENHKSIVQVTLIEVSNQKGEWTPSRNINKISAGAINNQSVIHYETKTSVLIPALEPNKNYALIVGYSFDDDLINKVLEINCYLKDGAVESAQNKMNELKNAVENKKLLFTQIASSTLKGYTHYRDDIYSYKAFYDVDLKEKYEKIENLFVSELGISLDEIKVLNEYLLSKNINSPYLTSLVGQVKKEADGRNILNGMASILLTPRTDKTNKYDLPKRLLNLDSSIIAVDKILFTINKIIAPDTSPFDSSIYSKFESLLATLIENRNKFKILTKDIINEIKNRDELTYSNWVLGASEFFSVKTMAGYHVFPTIGMVGIRAFGNIDNESFVRPFIGASIHLTPLDKNVTLKSYTKKKLLHRIGLDVGVTVIQIDKGEFKSAHNSVSYLTGGSYKLTNWITFSGGVVWIKRRDLNPAIEDFSTQPSPYAGFSFDIDVANTLSSLTGRIF